MEDVCVQVALLATAVDQSPTLCFGRTRAHAQPMQHVLSSSLCALSLLARTLSNSVQNALPQSEDSDPSASKRAFVL